MSSVDEAHMRSALSLAARGLGNTWPNPTVGCVIVKDGRVVGRGWTAPGGRPHGETEALKRAGAAARGATAYVTLEPCCHWGRTPPCTDALIAAGVSRVVVALRDPDPRVDGEGLRRLRAAGITVDEGLLEAEAAVLNAGFLKRQAKGLPLVTLKLATSLDGRIATASGESRWITGPAARRHGHALRGRHDAILVGSGTVLADDPDLTCRIPGFSPRPLVRVVADARGRVSPAARLFGVEGPVWIAVGEGIARPDLPAELLPLPPSDSGEGLDPTALLRALAERGITRVLLEGGGRLAAAFLTAGLIDRLAWFHAARVIGGDGLPAIAAMGFLRLEAAPKFRRSAAIPVGEDWLTEAVLQES
ncbi:diaminohydroxyphosphoribosylaminopyrimidine deaminase [Humitalea rosea]|uniref:Riboflavin biosynthesis protein RibD n=1 Tax=Humitalea rosea TaxID=990373 RepID=A0A2W7JA69_9PROT|nr:bifunctional diaminohydroxyphosphoribosylaminopyrimidine deaminase/5-amino-6-(5-phosphoribosylamino)uracil reductase RibD [Humitalea rosea]PZW49035.1 diaminohydroxyphosphoribosylaminopyrimidine deaminase [Humitalea rosea]